MNLTDYSLERLAVSYLRDRDGDAAQFSRLAQLRRGSRICREPGPFMKLLGWWVRLTALMLRYPIDPARAAEKLSAIGIPSALLGAPNMKGSGENV